MRAWLRVVDPGLLTTVQDLGRYGLQSRGVPVGGAVDSFALTLANRLVGNPDGAAGLEGTLGGPTLDVEVEDPGASPPGVLVALAGATCGATVDGAPLPPYRATWVPAGARLVIGPALAGARPVLAVAGGLDVPVVLGSRSTYLRGRFGGHEGRALVAGDRLPAGPVVEAEALRARDGLSVPPSHRPALDQHVTLRAVLGPQDDLFTPAAVASFLEGTWRVTVESDRMGARLEGLRLAHRRGADIVSDGTTAGSVQVPDSGLPIVLLADRQTTGGYAKIATVISADLPRLAQLLPGGSVRFASIHVAAARAAARAAEQALDDAVARATRDDAAAPWAASQRLLAANLVSGVTAGDGE